MTISILLLCILWACYVSCCHGSNDKWSADELFFAVRQDNEALILKQLRHPASDINVIGVGGQTPLMHAVLQGRETAVQVLLDRGADTTIAEKDGYTPLHGAGFQGRANIAKLLLHHGLDPFDMHNDGYLPLHRACWGREDRHTETVKVFLQSGVPPNAPSKSGKTCMEMTNNEATKALLQQYTKHSKVFDEL